ncbi:MAG: DUF3105 domain-containing protein [Thermocrispum sp.]
MASGTKNKGKRENALKAARAGVVNRKQLPWGTIIAVVVVLALAGAVFGYYLVKSAPKRDQETREETAAAYAPSRENQDPSKKIDGVVIKEYKHRGHVNAPERVAYDQEVPFGGPHDGVWATCNGTVYSTPVRTEHMVHSLEHGSVWIAYNPDKLDADAVDALELRVKNKPFTLMSPYPGLSKPISVQSWGHQLKLADPNDQRIDNFIAALRQNQYLTPEPNASCDSVPGGFDPANPPKFEAGKPGKGATPMDFDGQTGSMQGSGGQGSPPAGGAGAGSEEK